jgi:phosphoribosyl-dephospho-CoA transferase
MMLRRHDLLRAEPPTWDAMLQCHPGLADVPLVADWARLGRPVIVRRRMSGDGADVVPAALPLPPGYGKRRIAFSFPPDAVVTAVPPVLLRDAAPAAPAIWQKVIAALVAFGEVAGTPPCVFGALMWERATGLPYLTDRSDLDLLWHIANEPAAASLMETLLRLDALGPVRLDGELQLPDGAGVNWRELAQASDPAATVLAKTMDGVEVRAKAGLFRSPALAQ